MKYDKETIAAAVAGYFAKGGVPLHERDLAKALQLPFGHRGALRGALRELEGRGGVVKAGHGRWAGPAGVVVGGEEMEGTFICRYNGTKAFVLDDASRPPMAFEDAGALPAIHGDRVRVVPVGGGRGRMFEGGGGAGAGAGVVRLVQIVARGRKNVVGTLRVGKYYAYVTPRDIRVGRNIRLEGSKEGMKKREGHLVAAALLPPGGSGEVVGKLVKDLGDPDLAANDIPALVLDHGRSEDFPRGVKEEAGGAGLLRPDGVGRVDLRGKLVLTIDPSDAHDFDDAISIEQVAGGRTRLGVHIADVAAYVAAGSAVDREARRRGCSIYLVDRVIRMLPEELTVKTCSLRPGEDHLAHTVELTYDRKAKLVDVKTFRSVIRSRARLTYEGVQGFLETGDRRSFPAGVAEALEGLEGLTRRLRAARFRGGALDFSVPEAHCILGGDGEPLRFERRGEGAAYHLVEECMLAANRAVAELLTGAGVPYISRVHEAPDEEQWGAMGAELRALGVGEAPRTAVGINAMVRKARGDGARQMLTLAVLRNLNRAEYMAESRPHFGLGFRRYLHFTSPIRRYPDLVTHRILAAHEGGGASFYTREGLILLAREASRLEREAGEMEAESVRVKRIRYYANLLAAGERGPWEGVVTGLNPKGLMVELVETLQGGMLSYASLEGGRYVLAADGWSVRGGGGKGYRLGQRVWVELADVDERLGRVDWRPPAGFRGGGGGGVRGRGVGRKGR